jgi:hypothetical protein
MDRYKLQLLQALLSPLGTKLPAAHDRSRALHGTVDSKLVEYAHGVGLHGDAPADGVPARIALDEVGVKSTLVQGGGQAQASDAAPDYQDAFTCHVSSPIEVSQSRSGSPLVSGPNQIATRPIK